MKYQAGTFSLQEQRAHQNLPIVQKFVHFGPFKVGSRFLDQIHVVYCPNRQIGQRQALLPLQPHTAFSAPKARLTEGKKKLDLVRYSVLCLVLHSERVPLHLLYAKYHF